MAVTPIRAAPTPTSVAGVGGLDADEQAAQQLIDAQRAGHADREAERQLTCGARRDEPADL